MAKTNEAIVRESQTTWGTWEELLLACAVNRYGAHSWGSVAVEIQKRCSGPAIRHLLTPKNCEQKYLDLKRRYTPNQNKSEARYGGDDDDKPEIETIPWLDELRKLRVAELKRELERNDLSIVSLQMKVKRLKEDREGSENGEDKSDLQKSGEREGEDEGEEQTESKREPDKLSPELISGKSVRESDRDNQSVNESNSTDAKGEDNVQTVTVKVERETEPVRTGEQKTEPEIAKPFREDSCNGSSDSIAKEPVLVPVKVERSGGASESPELESVDESDGVAGGDGAKESSDVQSSASKLRKEGNDPVLRGSSIGDEPENEDHQSPATKKVSAKSQPLVDLLEIVRSHKLGSVFRSRLASQESPKYKNLIRQHVDLETLQTRLNEGLYSDCTHKFYRDLFLLVNNALIFFDNKSSESLAATELRQLISKKTAHVNSGANSSPQEKVPPPHLPLPSKKAREPSDSMLLKPKITGPVIVCRKRSSIAAKASASTTRLDRKKEQTAALNEETPVNNSEENQVAKKRTRDSFSSGSRSTKKNGKNRSNANPSKNSDSLSSRKQGREESPDESLEHKSEKKKNPNSADVKKQSAANFLNRMKRSSSSNNGSLIDTSNDTKGEQKRIGNSKGEGKKEQVTKKSLGGRQQKEKGSPKRAAGRPPKRAAAQPPPPPSAVSGKRSREVGDAEESAAAKQPKKRSRK